MILVDTSVWIEHLRSASVILMELLGDGEVLGHPFVMGEVALDKLRQRDVFLSDLRNLPRTAIATDEEVLRLIDREALFGRGTGMSMPIC